MKKRIPLIIDADPGIDDAAALLLAFANPKKFDIKLITSAVGNKSLALSVKNTLYLVENFAPYEIPVARGVNKTYDDKEEKNDASDIHGKWGLGKVKPLKTKQKPLKGEVSDIIYEKLKQSEEKVVIVALGPTINIAGLLKNHPDCKEKIDYIFVMGASVDGSGNITPYAEFNVYYDPKAFDILLNSGVKIIVSPLHLARESANSDEKYLNHKQKTKKDKLIHDLIAGSFEPSQPGYFCLHDAYTIHGLLRPSLYRFEKCDISVSLKKKNYGQTFITLNPEGKHYVQLAKNNNKIRRKMFKDMYK